MTQVTDADREAAASIYEWFSEAFSFCKSWQHIATAIRDRVVDDNAVVVRVARHREASTAALMGEVERLRGQQQEAFEAGWEARELKETGPSAAGYSDDSYDVATAWLLYDPATPSGRIDADWCGDYQYDTPSTRSEARAALSTPSEVSEPVADTIGGGEAEKAERAEHLRSEIRRCTVAIESGTADPWWYEDRGRLQQQLDALLCTTPPSPQNVAAPQPVSGDAVREALDDDPAQRLLIEMRARHIYEGWRGERLWVPWVEGGNSHKQEEARAQARREIQNNG